LDTKPLGHVAWVSNFKGTVPFFIREYLQKEGRRGDRVDNISVPRAKVSTSHTSFADKTTISAEPLPGAARSGPMNNNCGTMFAPWNLSLCPPLGDYLLGACA